MSALSAPAPTRRWWILGVIGIAQLMVILDNSIVNIALPSAQAELGFSDAQRQWVVTAYALAFGSLLLLGGRMSDLFGRKAAFMVGLVGFGAVSILGGLAPNFWLLVAARALQGVFGALLAPAALSLLTTTFPSGRERATAFGVFSALAGSGAAIGLLLGGALTEYVDWRWCMYVNAVFAILALVGATFLLPPHPTGERPHLDLLGTVTASLGLFGVVFGFATAETDGWTSPTVYAFLAAGVIVLGAFVLIQRRVRSPLLPLRVLLDRFRGGSYLTILVLTTGMFGVGLFLAYVMQQVFGFSPVLTGVSFLPMVACIVTASNTVPGLLLPRIGPKPLIVTGILLGAGGLFWFSFLTPTSTYAAHILGPLMLMGLGMGTAMSTAINTATLGVEPGDSGVASATVNTMQQVGGSVGTALLSSIAGIATAGAVRGGSAPQAAALQGYDVAFLVSAGIFVVGALVTGTLVPWGRPHRVVSDTGAPDETEAPEPPEHRVLSGGPVAPAAAAGATAGARHALDGSDGYDASDGADASDTAVAVMERSAPVLVGQVSGAVGGPATLTLVDAIDGAQLDRVVADDDGRYRLSTERPGQHLLVVSAPGARPVAERVTVDGSARQHDMRLEPSAP